MPEVPLGHLRLGHTIDAATHSPTGSDVIYEAADLTTHGVIVGMTGSGKTGLGVILLEEALLQGIPTLVIDPKGDMGNLCLTFPELSPTDFEPWIDRVTADREGKAVGEVAADTAALWKKGLERSGIDADRITQLRQSTDFTIYTPGSGAGVGLNVIGSLQSPGHEVDAETMADEVESFASSILGLVGIDADPLSSREHILISNLVANAWTSGSDLDIAGLIGQIQNPPMRKLGVIDLDAFYPPADRVELAMKLNGLIASPAFNSWAQGEPLDIQSLLYTSEGKPRCAIVSIAHLSDEERQFVVTLVLSKLVTWMRSQPGTSDLRALVYMDEVFGFVPPTAAPPAKKPILTILKQARAFGVGMVLSTQNPVDLDYKAISNAGTWMIGRLQTERDKARLLEGMTSASGGVDIAAVDRTISGLDKREFLLHTTKSAEPQVFGTRWAMSYLPGPLTRDQISMLMEGPKTAAASHAATSTPATPTQPEIADDETISLPEIAEGRRVLYLDASAPWSNVVEAAPGGTRLQPALLARVHLLYDETAADLRHEAEWEAVIYPLGGAEASLDNLIEVDYDNRDLRSTAPEGARYVLSDARLDTKTYFRRAESALRDHLHRSETLELSHNPALKLYSRVGESREDFERRCLTEADNRADSDVDKIRATLDKKMDRLRDAITKAEDKVREVEADASGRGREAFLSGALDVIGGLLGGRKSTRSILGGVRRASSKSRQKKRAEERLHSAENRLEEKMSELEVLEEELVDTLEDIQDDWETKAANIEGTEVPLEKTDITVDELVLVWIATA
jgi:Helicase HerA, central domain